MSLRIARVDPAVASDAGAVEALVELVNRAYGVAEAELFDPPAPRTDAAETAGWVAAGEIVAAWRGPEVVGAVRARLLDADTGWFGALAVDPAVDGQGVGSALVAFVEAASADAGARGVQIELLVPDPPLAHSLRLAGWYARRGYAEVERIAYADHDPAAAAVLTRPCAVSIRRKPLVR